MKNLSESPSFPFWSSLVICTATPFYFALVPLSFFLPIVLPTKLLSPGDWTHWSIFSACNVSLEFLPKTGFLKILHYQVSVFAKLALPPSLAPKETRIWRVWPPQEFPSCPWHSVEHPVCRNKFGMSSGLHCGLEPLTHPACPLTSQMTLTLAC